MRAAACSFGGSGAVNTNKTARFCCKSVLYSAVYSLAQRGFRSTDTHLDVICSTHHRCRVRHLPAAPAGAAAAAAATGGGGRCPAASSPSAARPSSSVSASAFAYGWRGRPSRRDGVSIHQPRLCRRAHHV